MEDEAARTPRKSCQDPLNDSALPEPPAGTEPLFAHPQWLFRRGILTIPWASWCKRKWKLENMKRKSNHCVKIKKRNNLQVGTSAAWPDMTVVTRHHSHQPTYDRNVMSCVNISFHWFGTVDSPLSNFGCHSTSTRNNNNIPKSTLRHSGQLLHDSTSCRSDVS